MLPAANQATGLVYAADVYDPRSVASSYNEPDTVLDLPYRSAQQEVYSYRVPNPKRVLKRGALLRITMTPEYKDGRRRVRDLVLTARPRTNAPAQSAADVVADLHAVGRGTRGSAVELGELLDTFQEMVRAGQDPFVVLNFDARLPLGVVRDFCRLIRTIDNPEGIRVDPPPEGHLYYRAFLPPEDQRDRAKRIVQPLELHLSAQGDGLQGTLTVIEEEWQEDSRDPILKTTDVPVANADALRTELAKRTGGLRVLLVFAPSRAAYGALARFIRPAPQTHPLIHVYLTNPDAAAEPDAGNR
jgi:hypothetical protein